MNSWRFLMGKMKWTLALVLIAATAIVGGAQQGGSSVKLSLDFPVPMWPANGVIPPELKSHYVFVDLAKNEYVVAYPENLGAPTFEKDGPAQRQVVRYKLQRDVDPKVAVVVTPSTAGKYKYAYVVSDGASAKGSIDQWAIVMPAGADGALKRPAGWFGVIQNGRKFAVADPDWIKGGSAATFAVDKQEERILPGAKKGGFELESDLKPGYTVGFFRQAESTDALLQTSGNIPFVVIHNATPPPPVAGAAPPAGGGGGFGGAQTPAGATTAWQPIKDDIDKLTQFEYNSKAVLTLAPKYDKTATDKTIAADFMAGITVLSKTGTLSPDSPFVKGTLSDLDAYNKAGGSGPLKLSAQPKGDAETEVFNAMKVSLHVN